MFSLTKLLSVLKEIVAPPPKKKKKKSYGKRYKNARCTLNPVDTQNENQLENRWVLDVCGTPPGNLLPWLILDRSPNVSLDWTHLIWYTDVTGENPFWRSVSMYLPCLPCLTYLACKMIVVEWSFCVSCSSCWDSSNSQPFDHEYGALTNKLFLCVLTLIWCLFHPRIAAVARKRPRSFCQKRRWQVTSKTEVGVGWLNRCPRTVWEPIRKRIHTQLFRERSATIVSARWATVDWSWHKERN